MKNSLYAITERRNQILAIINEHNEVTVDFLATLLNVTAVTIRRDLDTLASEQKISRIFGGAKKLHSAQDGAPAPSIQTNDQFTDYDVQKRQIAYAAANLLNEEDVVLINSSSTASYVVEYLGNKSITVISNNTNILSRKLNPLTILLMTGGQILPGRDSFSGTYALETLRKNYATKCIIGICGISIKGGLTSPVLEESIINQTMISQTTGTVIAIASSEKIGRDDSFYICDISEIDVLVTDEGITDTDRREFERNGIKVVIAKRPSFIL